LTAAGAGLSNGIWLEWVSKDNVQSGAPRLPVTTAPGRLSLEILANRMAAVNFRPSGFDYLRLILAVAVVAMHTVIVSHGQLVEVALWESPARPMLRLILPMFFALSGFLVSGSLERTRTLGVFVGLRIIRIVPALAIEVLLSALVLGPLLTSLTLGAYVSDPQFARYFLNILGHIHYTLPGVFETNPFPRIVNAQLWTVPFELYCYASLTLLALIGAVRRRWLVPLGAVALTVAYLVRNQFAYGSFIPHTPGPMPGILLVVSFLFGSTLYLYRDKVRLGLLPGLGALAASMVLVSVVPYGDYLAPLPVAYLTVWLGMSNPRRVGIISGADYSYGLFLYGYPIQQTIASLGPWTHHWYINLAGTLAIAVVVAALSWHWVEKPALKLRKPLERAEAWWLAKAPPWMLIRKAGHGVSLGERKAD